MSRDTNNRRSSYYTNLSDGMEQHVLIKYGNITGNVWDLAALIEQCPKEWSRLPQILNTYGLLKEEKNDSYLIIIGPDPYAPIYDVFMGVMAPSKEKAEAIMDKLQQKLEIEATDSTEFAGRLNQLSNSFKEIANACYLEHKLQKYTIGNVGAIGG